jgi:GNAT superfamily N-acetyltransferase
VAVMDISRVGESDLPQVLPLMRAYCDFYAVNPSDDDLMSLARALIAHPEREGVQLIARDGGGRAIGFATVCWTWSTLSASKIGVMNDLYVVSEARGTGVADALIAECSTLCRVHGARELAWQTAKDNYRAQAVYDRVGAVRAEWLDYSLPV